MNRTARAVGLLTGMAGAVLTLQAVVWMNAFVDPLEKEGASAVVDFAVAALKPAAPPPAPRKPDARPRSLDRNLAPLPDLGLGQGSSAITVDVPDYSQADLGDARDSLLGRTDDVAMTVETVDKAPVVRRGGVAYPEKARQRGLTGRVVVSLLIGTDGKVQRSRVLEATPAGVFEDAVLSSLPQWLFAPAEYQGRPVPIWVSLPLDFQPQ